MLVTLDDAPIVQQTPQMGDSATDAVGATPEAGKSKVGAPPVTPPAVKDAATAAGSSGEKTTKKRVSWER